MFRKMKKRSPLKAMIFCGAPHEDVGVVAVCSPDGQT